MQTRFTSIFTRAAMTLLMVLLTSMTAWAQDPASIGSIQYNSTLGAYEINSVENLNDLAVYVNGRGTYSTSGDETTAHSCEGLTFKQTANITYTGTNNYTPIGLYVNDDGFQGTFDGQGNTISGIDCTGDGLTGEAIYLGLFGWNQGTVRNVTLSGCRFASANNENYDDDNDAIYVGIGSIAGINYRTGTISNCTVTGGTVSRTRTEYAETFETFIGGIAGENHGSITDCTYSGSVSGTYSGSNINMGCTFHIGGIVGINKNGGSITGCGSDAAVSCSAPNVSGPSLSVGGIAGANNGAHGDTTVSGCFFSGTLSGTGKTGGSTSYIYIGAFVGKSINSSIVTNNYYYGDYTATIGDQSSTKSPVNLVRVYQLTGNSITATAPEGSGTTFKGVSYFKADATVTLGYTGEVPTGCGMRYSYNDGSEDHDVSGKTFEMPANDVTVTAKTIQLSGTCGDHYHESEVTWEVTDTDGDGTYETLTISGTGAMKNYTSYNPAPWAVFKSDITTAVIGDGVTRIGGNAFYNFTALTSVTIAPSVTTIGNAVFFGCTNLATINGASGVTYVDSSAFDETAWKNALPDGLTSVGHVAYRFVGDGTSVNLDAGTTQIYEYCFQESQITSIIIPASVERIGDYAFAHSYNLQKMYVLRNESTYPNTTQLGQDAFSECCDDLVIVVPTAAYSTYSGHWSSFISQIQPGYTITCNEGITATSYAPIVAQGETVTLSGTGTIPDGYAFAGYSVTKDGTNPAETVTVTEASGVYSFTMPASDVTVSATTIQLSGTCGAMENDDVNWAVTDTDDDGTYDKLTISGTGRMANYTSNQPWAAFKSDITTAVIEDGVTRIGMRDFYQFTALTSVTIASSVTTIGMSAFKGCTSLANIDGASGVTFIEPYALNETAWRINLPDGMNCVGHVAYRFKGDATSTTITDGTTQINENCFLNSKITSIVIPASVTSIGDMAFKGCTDLSKVYVLRNGASDNEITSLESDAFENCTKLTAIIVPADAYNYYNALWSSFISQIQPGYTVTCGTAGITATTDGPLVTEYEVVTLNHNDRADYAFNGYSVKDSKNCDVAVYEEDGVYTFQMPANDVTVTATWEPANKITVTANKVGSNYWTTFYCGEAGYRIDDDEEATAYTATVDNSTVTLHLLGKVIPMGTAAIIIGEDNSISMNRDDFSIAEYSADNDLHGVDVRTLKSTLGTGTFYVLGSTTENGFGFHKYNADYMPARKAYLLLDGGVAQASSLTMVFDNETMEIKTTDFTDYTDKADTWYSLDGRKLDKQPTKAGVYINGSRKVVIK